VPEHAHPNEQAGYIIQGKFEVNIGGEKGVLEKDIISGYQGMCPILDLSMRIPFYWISTRLQDEDSILRFFKKDDIGGNRQQ